WSVESFAQEPPKAASPPDYKLVYWFDWSDPVPTFRHHAYNLLRGEYPAEAVSSWKNSLRQTHPNYAVLIRDIRLDDLPGKSDAEKLSEAVRRQFSEVLMIASVPGPTPSLGPPVSDTSPSHRQALRPAWSTDSGPWTGLVPNPINQVYPSGRPPLGSAGFQPGPGPTPTPFPMPYPRPHP
ncbi:MAG TPA: hypothetical protein VFT74_18135, partial [Isosphaeraceae bacterium]|nr:hypothetical protein [Isosphaeraceae bacterium]